MLKDHLFPVPGQVLRTASRSSYEVSHQPNCGQPLDDFETKAINTAQYLPRIWKRYVDDTCVFIDSARKEEFLEHINSIDPHIQFTTEDVKPDGSIYLLDTIVMSQPDRSLITSV